MLTIYPDSELYEEIQICCIGSIKCNTDAGESSGGAKKASDNFRKDYSRRRRESTFREMRRKSPGGNMGCTDRNWCGEKRDMMIK